MNHSDIVARIESFRKFNYPGWNGYDADPVSDETIANAIKFSETLLESDWEVFLTGRGTVQFERGSGDSYTETEVN